MDGMLRNCIGLLGILIVSVGLVFGSPLLRSSPEPCEPLRCVRCLESLVTYCRGLVSSGAFGTAFSFPQPTEPYRSLHPRLIDQHKGDARPRPGLQKRGTSGSRRQYTRQRRLPWLPDYAPNPGTDGISRIHWIRLEGENHNGRLHFSMWEDKWGPSGHGSRLGLGELPWPPVGVPLKPTLIPVPPTLRTWHLITRLRRRTIFNCKLIYAISTRL